MQYRVIIAHTPALSPPHASTSHHHMDKSRPTLAVQDADRHSKDRLP